MGSVSGDSNILGILGAFHDRRLLDRFEANAQFYQLGEKRPLASNDGTTITFHYFSVMGEGGLLTEATQPANSFMTSATRVGTIVQFGQVTEMSDVLYKTSIVNLREQAADQFGDSSARTIDKYIQDRIYSDGTTFATAGHEGPWGTFKTKSHIMSSWLHGVHGGLSAEFLSATTAGQIVRTRSQITTVVLSSTAAQLWDGICDITTYGMSLAKLRHIVCLLESANVPTINGSYVAVMHPKLIKQLRNDAEWTDWMKYQNADKMMNGEVGMVENVKILKSTNCLNGNGAGGATVSMTADYSASLATILGKGTFAVTELDGEGIKMYDVPFDAPSLDNVLKQRAALGWKYTGCAKVLQPTAGYGVVCPTYG